MLPINFENWTVKRNKDARSEAVVDYLYKAKALV
jgi:hypothetical protein